MWKQMGKMEPTFNDRMEIILEAYEKVVEFSIARTISELKEISV